MLEKLFKITFLKTEYIIKENDGVVVCKLYYKINYNPSSQIIYDYLRWEFFDFCVVGVSRCASEDTFDINKGKYIAESKAKKKLYTRALKTIENFKKTEIDPAIAGIIKSYDFYSRLVKREEKHIIDVSESDR